MNEGQEEFLDFFIARTLKDKRDEAEQVLIQAFSEQEHKKLTTANLTDLQNTLLPLVKPENYDEVEAAMKHFANSL
ncbi:MAG: hypothetical protein ABF723_07050 [Lentilactobacillus hilgardii]|uniref:hypothetical protein n=1 Tax=Lentilactobacillus hilgardii TaxID=1588 RepID=UPI001CC1C422|nr:hypothetical protein [Lentilactobacillus hilgardii]MBZ2200173.1 hypothetical protein [Lentilactobacillus hilgardii]MBZ2203214.1 hypothetical protein [Lentilactobacillus hilgardii]MCT3400282.1 hypothetical protein [Lentilactobacillus hilgardii]